MDTARSTPTWRFSEPINIYDSESDLKTSSRLAISEAAASKSTRVSDDSNVVVAVNTWRPVHPLFWD